MCGYAFVTARLSIASSACFKSEGIMEAQRARHSNAVILSYSQRHRAQFGGIGLCSSKHAERHAHHV